MNKFILDLTETTSMTFVCKNATKNDVNTIMFEWSLFEIFGSNAYLYEIHPDFSFNDSKDLEEVNTYYKNRIYRIDVNSHCNVPFIVKTKHQVSYHVPSPPLTGRSNTTTTHHKWDLAPNDFDWSGRRFKYSEGSTNSQDSMHIKQVQWARTSSAIIDLVQEVIGNGCEKDLLPNDEDEIKLSQIDTVTTTTTVINRLSLKYKIFDILKEKLKDKVHQMMQSPLNQFPALMLGLLLYTDGDCSHKLSRALRDGKYRNWKHLACAVRTGVFILNKFQRFHNLSIFSGLCDVFLDPQQAIQPNGRIRGHLKSPVSFSTDLSVAKEFRGSAGMLMELKIDDSINYNICMADVSWISKFSSEKEVLVIDLPLDIAPSQCLTRWNGKNPRQFVCLTKHSKPENLLNLFGDGQLSRNNIAVGNTGNMQYQTKTDMTKIFHHKENKNCQNCKKNKYHLVNNNIKRKTNKRPHFEDATRTIFSHNDGILFGDGTVRAENHNQSWDQSFVNTITEYPSLHPFFWPKVCFLCLCLHFVTRLGRD